MNLTHLKYICEVEKYGSISKAAEHLYLNQPRLSKIIKDMERDMNLKIFERTSKGVRPTKKGFLFLNQAKMIINEVDYLEQMYQAQQHTLTLDVSVPRASYISTAFVNYLNETKMINHEVKINYRETNSTETMKKVFEGEDNLGIIRFPIEDESYYLNMLAFRDLTYKKLFEFDYHLLMSKDNPLVYQDICLNDLKNQIELIHGDVSLPETPLAFTNQMNERLSSSRVINIYERGSQFEILDKLKNSYMWVSPMPQETLERFHLVQKECLDMNTRCMDILIYRKGYRLSDEDKEFIDSLKDVINHIGISKKE